MDKDKDENSRSRKTWNNVKVASNSSRSLSVPSRSCKKHKNSLKPVMVKIIN